MLSWNRTRLMAAAMIGLSFLNLIFVLYVLSGIRTDIHEAINDRRHKIAMNNRFWSGFLLHDKTLEYYIAYPHKTELGGRIRELREQETEQLDRLDAILKYQPSREALRQLKAQHTHYLEIEEAILKRTAEGETGQASQLFHEQLHPLTYEMQLSIETLGTYQENLMDSVLEEIRSTRLSMVILVTISLLLSLAFVLVLRVFRRKEADLQQLTALLKKLPQEGQELSYVNLDHDSADEFKVIARTFNELSNRLEEKNQLLTLSSQQKKNILGVLSHELRTPLNSIIGLSDMLAQDESNADREFAHLIHRSGTELLGTINDLLDLSAAVQGTLEAEAGPVNLRAFAETLDGYFRPFALQKGLDFTVRVEAGVPEIFYTDERMLQRILVHLLSNAGKFTERGGVSLTIRGVEQEDREAAFPVSAASAVSISVSDTGAGIAEDQRSRIFQLFHAPDQYMTRQQGGIGVGLSLCAEFVKILGGELRLASREKEGSTFTLLIPTLAEDSLAIDAPASQEAGGD
ncbi:ATP-binding protein [Paenibacillus caseinilyticus]|uniref:histidine kinase n=1 Tax=Paenibacillus mucilaginosus K02 TaxID=997761 RepID=I0BGS1_9BACL|nr:ATP-binding protein [Paenibacillus mucilaginosus]AFH61568.1 hypothetical protein B2K_12680 [Paenibacillus mucilaginosus K02]